MAQSKSPQTSVTKLDSLILQPLTTGLESDEEFKVRFWETYLGNDTQTLATGGGTVEKSSTHSAQLDELEKLMPEVFKTTTTHPDFGAGSNREDGQHSSLLESFDKGQDENQLFVKETFKRLLKESEELDNNRKPLREVTNIRVPTHIETQESKQAVEYPMHLDDSLFKFLKIKLLGIVVETDFMKSHNIQKLVLQKMTHPAHTQSAMSASALM